MLFFVSGALGSLVDELELQYPRLGRLMPTALALNAEGQTKHKEDCLEPTEYRELQCLPVWRRAINGDANSIPDASEIELPEPGSESLSALRECRLVKRRQCWYVTGNPKYEVNVCTAASIAKAAGHWAGGLHHRNVLRARNMKE